MSGAIHPLPQYAFMAWCLVKAQGQLYLLPFIAIIISANSIIIVISKLLSSYKFPLLVIGFFKDFPSFLFVSLLLYMLQLILSVS
jgi:hypothetical protein